MVAPRFYAVHRGLVPSIYYNWANCKDYVLGFPGVRYKSFDFIIEAQNFMHRDD